MDVKEKTVSVSGTNVTLTTTTETVIISSPIINLPSETATILIKAWAVLTTGAGTTTVTPRVRRGAVATGTQVGEANAETIKAVAGSTEPFSKVASEQRSGVGSVQYSLTLEQAGATGDGTSLEAGIEVEVL